MHVELEGLQNECTVSVYYLLPNRSLVHDAGRQLVTSAGAPFTPSPQLARAVLWNDELTSLRESDGAAL